MSEKENKAKAKEAMQKLFALVGHQDKEIWTQAADLVAKALTEPLRDGIMDGDILGNIFEVIQLAPGAAPRYELSLLAPGTEKDHVAYTVPNQGRIPDRHVEADYIMVNTYPIASSIDMLRNYAKDSRLDVIGQVLKILRDSAVKKMNDDGFHTLISAAVDRNVLVYDADASNGVFSKKLVSLMKLLMRRNGGGNSTSLNRGELTDLYISPEAQEDIRNFDVSEVDEITRRELITGEGGLLVRIFQTNLHILDELGVGQEYQNYYADDLGAAMPSGKQEIVLGLDQRSGGSFVMPFREAPTIYSDPTYHRSGRLSWYLEAEAGFGCLDTRRVMVGAV